MFHDYVYTDMYIHTYIHSPIKHFLYIYLYIHIYIHYVYIYIHRIGLMKSLLFLNLESLIVKSRNPKMAVYGVEVGNNTRLF